ncbi:hypothetical protein AA313_de0208543 [Arthrobotrys entomopaga]|nr:hypothetical protein AA313_de0208543 [Arthrobotrys entomopaga]
MEGDKGRLLTNLPPLPFIPQMSMTDSTRMCTPHMFIPVRSFIPALTPHTLTLMPAVTPMSFLGLHRRGIVLAHPAAPVGVVLDVMFFEVVGCFEGSFATTTPDVRTVVFKVGAGQVQVVKVEAAGETFVPTVCIHECI